MRDFSDGTALLTMAQAARIFGVTWQTLYAWEREGRGPPSVRVALRAPGGATRYPLSDVRSFIDSHVVAPRGENPTAK